MGRGEKDEVTGWILLAIVVIAAVIQFMQAIYPLAFLGTIISIPIMLICALRDSSTWESPLFPYAAGLFALCLLATIISHEIGFTFGGSPLGKGIITMAKTINLVEEVQDNATMQAIDISENASLTAASATNASDASKSSITATYDILRLGLYFK